MDTDDTFRPWFCLCIVANIAAGSEMISDKNGANIFRLPHPLCYDCLQLLCKLSLWDSAKKASLGLEHFTDDSKQIKLRIFCGDLIHIQLGYYAHELEDSVMVCLIDILLRGPLAQFFRKFMSKEQLCCVLWAEKEGVQVSLKWKCLIFLR